MMLLQVCWQCPRHQPGSPAQVVADSLGLPPRPPPGTHPLPPGARVSSLQVQILMIIYSITSCCRAGPRSNLLASEIQIDLIRLVRLYLPIPPLTVLNQNIQLTLENHSYIEKLLAIFFIICLQCNASYN